jgi:hypothetical protein
MCVSCNNIIANCDICVSNVTCSVCKPNYILYYNSNTKTTTCVQVCPLSYYPTATTISTSLACQPCLDSSCLQCITNSTTNSYQCLSCANNTFLLPSLGICITQCYTGYYPIYTTNGNNQICVQCPLGCQSCINSTVCASCSDGYILDIVNSRCVTVCGIGYYQFYNSTYVGYVCVKCNTNNGCIDCIYNNNNNNNNNNNSN